MHIPEENPGPAQRSPCESDLVCDRNADQMAAPVDGDEQGADRNDPFHPDPGDVGARGSGRQINAVQTDGLGRVVLAEVMLHVAVAEPLDLVVVKEDVQPVAEELRENDAADGDSDECHKSLQAFSSVAGGAPQPARSARAARTP